MSEYLSNIQLILNSFIGNQDHHGKIITYCETSVRSGKELAVAIGRTKKYVEDSLSSIAENILQVSQQLTEFLDVQSFELNNVVNRVNSCEAKLNCFEHVAANNYKLEHYNIRVQPVHRPKLIVLLNENLPVLAKPRPKWNHNKIDLDYLSNIGFSTSNEAKTERTNTGYSQESNMQININSGESDGIIHPHPISPSNSNTGRYSQDHSFNTNTIGDSSAPPTLSSMRKQPSLVGQSLMSGGAIDDAPPALSQRQNIIRKTSTTQPPAAFVVAAAANKTRSSANSISIPPPVIAPLTPVSSNKPIIPPPHIQPPHNNIPQPPPIAPVQHVPVAPPIEVPTAPVLSPPPPPAPPITSSSSVHIPEAPPAAPALSIPQPPPMDIPIAPPNAPEAPIPPPLDDNSMSPPPPKPVSSSSGGGGRQDLLAAIQAGKKLKKAVTVDKSDPLLAAGVKPSDNSNNNAASSSSNPSQSAAGAPPKLGGGSGMSMQEEMAARLARRKAMADKK